MAMINFMGGIGAAYQGAQEGARQTRADEKQQAQDASDAQVRDANTALVPLKAQAATLATQAEIDSSRDKAALSPGEQQLKVQQQKADIANAPEAIRQQGEKLQNSAFANVIANAKSRQEAEQGVLGVAGEHLQNNDIGGFNAILKEVWHSPLFPGTNQLPAPVSTTVANAPPGSVDLAGNPIAGQALQITLADGSTKFLNPKPIADAYQLRRATIAQANKVKLKAGEAEFDGLTGRKIVENTNGFSPDGNPLVKTDIDGNIVPGYGRGVGGVGGRSGAATGGKAEASPVMTAVKFALENTDSKLTPNQRGAAQDYARTISALSGMSAEQAARVAVAASQEVPDGKDSRLTTQLNIKNGTFDLYYTDPQIAGGTPVPIAPNTSKASAIIGKLDKTAFNSQLSEMLGEMSGGDATQAATLQAAATDEKLRSRIIADAKKTPGDPASVQAAVSALERKLDMLRHLPKVAGRAGGVNPSATAVPGAGIQRASAYAPDPDSPAGKAKAMRDSAAVAAAAKKTEHEKSSAELAVRFAADLNTLAPIDLVRKYDDMRGQLSAKDAALLKNSEKQIY